MGAWATVSLFVVGIFWMEVEANPQLFQDYQRPHNYGQNQFRTPGQQQLGLFHLPREKPGGVAVSQSALDFQPQNRLKLTQTIFPKKYAKYDQNDPVDNAYPLYENFEKNFEKNLEPTSFQTFPNKNEIEKKGVENQASANGYDDHKTSQTTHFFGPHQLETIDSEHFHKQVPAFDISEFQHHGKEHHGEVHYHQHKHIHNHQHKQEHVHQHKQDHQHKHQHNQQHKHDHHSDHKHGHEHKHDHHQEHKHDHHHEHKHNNHHNHHHQHGHKHQHHAENKHQHHHQQGHKHSHQHRHKHQHSKRY